MRPVLTKLVGVLLASAMAMWPALAQSVKPIDPSGRSFAGPGQDVDLELVLAVDVSGSMDDEEHRIQRQGYAAALRHPDVHRAIQSGARRRIAVIYFEWAGNHQQHVTVDWTLIHDGQSATAVAEKLLVMPRAPIRGTSISSGLAFAGTLFGKAYRGDRRVIDISGDGPNNRGPAVEPVRAALLGQGIVINGLPLTISPTYGYYGTDGGLTAYYRDCVIGGPGSFVIPVTDINQFAEAVRRKLILEIAGLNVPVEPFGRREKTVRVDRVAKVNCGATEGGGWRDW